MLVILFLFSRATNIARSFRLIEQLHHLIHIGKWTKLFSRLLSSQITYVEAVEFSRFSFHHFQLPASASTSLNDTITSEINFDEFQSKTIMEQRLHTPSTATARPALLKTLCSRHLYARSGYYIVSPPCK